MEIVSNVLSGIEKLRNLGYKVSISKPYQTYIIKVSRERMSHIVFEIMESYEFTTGEIYAENGNPVIEFLFYEDEDADCSKAESAYSQAEYDNEKMKQNWENNGFTESYKY